MSRERPLPVNETIQGFLHGDFNNVRQELMQRIQQEIFSGTASKQLRAALTREMVKNDLGPQDGLGLMLAYGILIGVLCERQNQKKIII